MEEFLILEEADMGESIDEAAPAAAPPPMAKAKGMRKLKKKGKSKGRSIASLKPIPPPVKQVQAYKQLPDNLEDLIQVQEQIQVQEDMKE
jgi:hypothetical protein